MNHKKTRIAIQRLFIIFTLTVLFVGMDEVRAQTKVTKEKVNVAIGTAGTGGIYYILGASMAKVLNERAPNINATALATTGGIENMRLASDGKIFFGGTMPMVAWWAYNAEEMYARDKSGPKKNLRFLYGGHDTITHIVVRANSKIQSIADLKGKRVGLGAPGSLLYPIGKHSLEMYGVTEKDITASYLGQAECADGVRDGSLDAAALSAGLPHPTLIELITSTPIRILPIEPEHVTEKYKNLGYVLITIPAGTYKGLDKDIPTTNVVSTWIASAEQDSEVSYTIVKTIMENTKEMQKIHPAGAQFNLKRALTGANIPLHPGAVKYYKEAGVFIPKHLLPE